MDWTYESFIRVYLGVFFTGIALFYSLRLVLSKHKGPLTFLGKPGSRHFLGHITFRIFRILIWGICVTRIFYPSLDKYLFIIQSLNRFPLTLIGILLMTTGFAFVIYSHKTMGKYWRLGIDPDGVDQLVTQGIFSKSRNPIFIGVVTGQFGFFLALPSLFTMICLMLGVSTILSQIKIEEKHLSKRFGQAYLEYFNRVPRWF